MEYIPGVRLYFDAEAIIKDGLGEKDGLHILKIKNKLLLNKYLVESVSSEPFNIKDWTPSIFTNLANKYFLEGR